MQVKKGKEKEKGKTKQTTTKEATEAIRRRTLGGRLR